MASAARDEDSMPKTGKVDFCSPKGLSLHWEYDKKVGKLILSINKEHLKFKSLTLAKDKDKDLHLGVLEILFEYQMCEKLNGDTYEYRVNLQDEARNRVLSRLIHLGTLPEHINFAIEIIRAKITPVGLPIWGDLLQTVNTQEEVSKRKKLLKQKIPTTKFMYGGTWRLIDKKTEKASETKPTPTKYSEQTPLLTAVASSLIPGAGPVTVAPTGGVNGPK